MTTKPITSLRTWPMGWTVTAALMTGVAAALLATRWHVLRTIEGLLPQQEVLSEFFTLAVLFAMISASILGFLQRGAPKSTPSPSVEAIREVTQPLPSFSSYTGSTSSGEAVEELSRKVDLLSSPFTDEQRIALAKAATDAVAAQAVSSKIEELAFRVGKDFQKGRVIETLERNTVITLARLNSAIPDLTRRGNLNLTIGITMTLIGVIVLAFGVFVTVAPAATASAWEYLTRLLPRLSLAVLIEIFAYFFLRLYKDNLAAITFLQNEMTNVEVARSALAIVILSDDAVATSQIATAIAALDRNRILSPAPAPSGDVTAKSAIELLNQAVSLAKAAK